MLRRYCLFPSCFVSACWVRIFICGALPVPVPASDAPELIPELPALHISGNRTVNERSADTFSMPVSELKFEPKVDVQSRNMAEAQGDVTIRGGIFENTGFVVGSATLIDPQTGHYSAELPIAPEMLTAPEVLTGVDNAVRGFNSTVGTLRYGWAPIVDGGSVTAAAGDNNLNSQRARAARTVDLTENGEWSLGVEAEGSRSEGDGTRDFGDHDFERLTGRVQLRGPRSQTDIFAGYQAKFFGWFGMYTGRAFLGFGPFETENLKTRLYLINHRQNYGDGSYFEATAYRRRHSDEYQFNRFDPTDEFIHETKVHSVGVSGVHVFGGSSALRYSAQATADEIDSNSLEQGDFTSRSYLKATLLPQYSLRLAEGEKLTFRAGGSFDDSNRDSSKLSPIADVTWERHHGASGSEQAYLSFAQTTQVTGYTGIGGSEDPNDSLFTSNRDLGRETTRNLELGGSIDRGQWSLETAVFYRWDDDLVDWTFSTGDTSARTANNVDLETFGVEVIGTRRWGRFEGILGYTYLEKDEDFGDASVDASFYALNHPRHRVTLGLLWRAADWLELRADNEWRRQRENLLRESGRTAFFTHASVNVYPPRFPNLELFFTADNLWDEEFEDLPGTPGRGRQFTVGATLTW